MPRLIELVLEPHYRATIYKARLDPPLYYMAYKTRFCAAPKARILRSTVLRSKVWNIRSPPYYVPLTKVLDFSMNLGQ